MSKIIVKAKRDGYRRADIKFSKAGTPIDTDAISAEQLDAINADPNLTATTAEGEIVPKTKPAKGKGKGGR